MIEAPENGLLTKHRDSPYGELSAGDVLTIHPAHRTGWDQELPSYTFELTGFDPTSPHVAHATVAVDGKKTDRLQRIDFNLLGDWMFDRTAELTGDQRYAAVPIYLHRSGSTHTEVV